MSYRIRQRGITNAVAVLLAACAGLFVAGSAAAAEANTYVEGTADRSFTIDRWDSGWSWDQGAADETLTLTLDGLAPLSTPAVTSGPIAGVFSLGGQPVGRVSFVRFVLHVEIDIDAAFEPLPVVSYTSRPGGTDFQDANVTRRAPGLIEFEPRLTNYGERPGGSQLTYQISFQVPSGGATGTIRVFDFSLEYGQYVEPPDDDGDGGGGGNGGGGGGDDGDKDKPSGVAYMGGSGDGSGSGSGGSGTGSGQGGGNSAGVRVGEGTGSIDTDAPVATSPRSTAADPITGYPLRLEDVTGGSEDGSGGGSGGGGSAAAGPGGGSGSGLSWRDLAWLAVALAVASPFVAAEIDRRRVRRRLRDLVEETPDGPAPRVTAPA